ncbi:glycoside hydrolase family 5 protein [Ophiostoma piceae UAMH 11346]|uniref:Mannan endo-1,4-beta-mannosidase A n=1 Tax=Ophiostoma piceae (strain UAMH 11346) TaxID=1262450 RepID=S3CP75_OPHP1|nr:glycoside hydrolase family 5 protein [Ophiostoma piceae UAMH 11346]
MIATRLVRLLGLTAALLTNAVSAAPSAAVAAAASVPSTSGLRFVFNGSPSYLTGTNAYWLPFLTNNADVDLVMDHVAKSGLKILRVWGFNDVTTKPSDSTVYFQYLSASGSQINTGSNGLQRLDYVVKSAAQHGVSLIINFVNNWSDYGGMPAYVSVYGGTKEGWYTNSKAQAQYRLYIKEIVSRYADSSSIFAWELANESRCNGCATSVIHDWAASTSAYIKGLDSKHLVTLGDEGFGLSGDTSYPYQTGEGLDFEKNLGISTIDFGTYHLYPKTWGVSQASFPTDWIKYHAAACKRVGKPCLLEEYGSETDHCSVEKPWREASLALKDSGMGADMFWQWGDQLSTGKTSDDGYTIFYGSSDAKCLIY